MPNIIVIYDIGTHTRIQVPVIDFAVTKGKDSRWRAVFRSGMGTTDSVLLKEELMDDVVRGLASQQIIKLYPYQSHEP